MNCKPTDVPAAHEIDIPALREKYRLERDKRLNPEGQRQYVRVAGESPATSTPPTHTMPVAPREPVVRGDRRRHPGRRVSAGSWPPIT